ncbi:MAG: hypothetical protein ACT4P7_11260 [Gemmatimonadaceae bacterium]
MRALMYLRKSCRWRSIRPSDRAHPVTLTGIGRARGNSEIRLAGVYVDGLRTQEHDGRQVVAQGIDSTQLSER